MNTAAGIASGDFNRVLEAAKSRFTSMELANDQADGLLDAKLSGPGGATLKAKYKLDLLLMLCRQQEWLQAGMKSKWISLCI